MSLLALYGGAFLLIAFLLGFAIVLFGDAKKYAIGSALYCAAPLACLISFLTVMINVSSFKLGIGLIMLLIAIVLYTFVFMLRKALNLNPFFYHCLKGPYAMKKSRFLKYKGHTSFCHGSTYLLSLPSPT